MGPCCVEGCEVTGEETYYFEFPTSRQLRRSWLQLTRVSGKLPLGAVVCSRHFPPHDYELVRGRVRLKRKVVPSLLLDLTTPQPKENAPESPKPPQSEETPKPQKSSPTPPKSPPVLRSPPARSPSPIPPKSPKVTAACDSTVSDLPEDEPADQRTGGQTDERTVARTDVQTDKQTPDSRHRTESSEICKVVNNDIGRWNHNIDLANVPLPDPRQDIEEMITNYHIINKPLAARPPCPPPCDLLGGRAASPLHTIEIDDKDPVFIEVPVDKDNPSAGGGSQDCLMLLESVQVDVDPDSLMLPHPDDREHDDDNDNNDTPERKEDPISLLTSSDEDDVIIEEPHIDTVEVSDETDEDDVPLVKLVKKTPKKKLLKKKTKKINKQIQKQEDFENVMWNMLDYYCMQCHYSTNNSVEYNNHMNEHSTVLQVCPICSYTSASKTMFSRHIRKHREEKKFRCHICDYRAKHNMSLIYHLKSHDSANLESVKRGFKCKKCGFQSDVKATLLKHVRLCSTGVKKYSCDKCVYETKRWSDLKRHLTRRHKEFGDDECVEEASWT